MIPEHITVDVVETGAKLEKEEDSLPEIAYTTEFSYTLKFTAKTKLGDSGGGSGGSGGGTGGSGGGSGGSGGSSPEITVNATNITIISPFKSVKIRSVSGDSVNISGSYFLAFDDYYKFVRKTGEQLILPPDTKEPDIALIQYKMPPLTTRIFEYPFKVQWPAGSSYEGTPIESEVIVKQESFWTTTAASAYIDVLKELKF